MELIIVKKKYIYFRISQINLILLILKDSSSKCIFLYAEKKFHYTMLNKINIYCSL